MAAPGHNSLLAADIPLTRVGQVSAKKVCGVAVTPGFQKQTPRLKSAFSVQSLETTWKTLENTRIEPPATRDGHGGPPLLLGLQLLYEQFINSLHLFYVSMRKLLMLIIRLPKLFT